MVCLVGLFIVFPFCLPGHISSGIVSSLCVSFLLLLIDTWSFSLLVVLVSVRVAFIVCDGPAQDNSQYGILVNTNK